MRAKTTSSLKCSTLVGTSGKLKKKAVLGVPGGTRPAHIVQLGPVGVEGVAAEGPPQNREGGRQPRSLSAGLGAVLGSGLGHGAFRRWIWRPASPASCPLGRVSASQGSRTMIGLHSLKSASNLAKWYPVSATNPREAFPIPCRNRDDCRQRSRNRVLPSGVGLATSARKIPTSREGRARSARPAAGFRRTSRGIQ